MLQCGEMLSAVLLDATMAGLATCTLTHITELPASREIVAALIVEQTTHTPGADPRRPGAVDRRRTTPDARRPLDEVFEVHRGPTTAQQGLSPLDGGRNVDHVENV